MKKTVAYLLAGAMFVCSTAFTIRLISILDQLKIVEREAKEYIFSDFTGGVLQFPYSEVAKNLAVNKRAEVVKQLGDYIRKYTESKEFAQAYEAYKAEMAGYNPQKKSKEQLLTEKIAELKEDMRTAEEDMKSASGDMKKLYEFTLKQLKENLAALENPSHPKHKMYLADLIEEHEEAYQEEMEMSGANDPQYAPPATPRDLVKLRLKEFLDLTADIDFNAKLVQSGKVKKFADPRLEAKSHEWKYCFRAGKETITAAREYARNWLNALK